MHGDPRHAITAILAERDIECPGCGYNLRGLHADTNGAAPACPECGEPVTLDHLKTVIDGGLEPPTRFIAALNGVFAGVGTLVAAAVFLRGAVGGGSGAIDHGLVIGGAVMTMLSVLLGWLWVRGALRVGHKAGGLWLALLNPLVLVTLWGFAAFGIALLIERHV